MQIFVKTPTGKTITLDVETWDSIDFVKAVIQDRTLVAKERQSLRLEGKAAAGGSIVKQLENVFSLSYYCMPRSGQTLHLELQNLQTLRPNALGCAHYPDHDVASTCPDGGGRPFEGAGAEGPQLAGAAVRGSGPLGV